MFKVFINERKISYIRTYIGKQHEDWWAQPHWQHEELAQSQPEMTAPPHYPSSTPLNYQQSESAESAFAAAYRTPFSGKPF